MKFTVIPLSLKEANDFVTKHHRHNKKATFHKFSIGAMYENEIVGVAIVGRPVSRCLDDRLVAEVLRVCIKDPPIKNACSFLYGRCWRIWQAMGGEKILTYTLTTESGSSMRAIGWKNVHTTKKRKEGSGWENREGRSWQPIIGKIKYRWEQEK
jgi:hypothetical protein